MKSLLLILSFSLLVGKVSFSQSAFKPLPKVVNRSANMFGARAVTASQPDSLLKAWRFIANIAAYSEPGNIAEAGIGYGYQSLKYNYAAQKWDCLWSVSAVGFAGGSVAPSTPASIMSAALMVGLVNNLFLIGPQYNFGTKQFGVAVSIGINLNN